MLAPKSEIETKTDCVFYWLDNAGTDKSVTFRTLKVQDADAYNALESYLPVNWKIGAEGTTVVDKNNAEINIE